MSDFDKEAEREKLREKYEREEAKRETTEQMSELLLKGATMTNAHCGECSDPIFRYDGQEFCPTCQKPVDRGTGDDADDPAETGSSDQNGQPQGGIEVTSPSDEATVKFGGDDGSDGKTRAEGSPAPTADDPQTGDQSGLAATGNEDTERQQIPSADPSTPANSAGTNPPTSPADQARPSQQTSGTASDHLDRAQVVLAQTVERFSREAADTDDPRAAREYLETARAAAQTLDATRF